jgi:hypothetical protein
LQLPESQLATVVQTPRASPLVGSGYLQTNYEALAVKLNWKHEWKAGTYFEELHREQLCRTSHARRSFLKHKGHRIPNCRSIPDGALNDY